MSKYTANEIDRMSIALQVTGQPIAAAMLNEWAAELREREAPIPMVLFCPECGLRHVDAPESDVTMYPEGAWRDGPMVRVPGWKNPPHRSHLCHGCGCIWRPADVATVGVAKIETRGKADTFDAAKEREAAKGVTKEILALAIRARNKEYTRAQNAGEQRSEDAELRASGERGEVK